MPEIRTLNGYDLEDAKAREKIAKANDLTTKRYILFGDSYLTAYQVGGTYAPEQSWGTKLQQRLGIADEDFIKTGTTGGSFAKPDGVHWQDQVDSLSVSSPETIDHIILVGGTNDFESDGVAIKNAITIFADKCRAKFPNAKLSIGCIVGHTRHWGIPETLNTITHYKKGCMLNKIAFMSGIEYTVRHMAYMQSDTIHVTEDAQELICDAVENFLLGGSIDTKVYGQAPFAAAPGTEHTFSTNSVISGINNGTAFLKNNQQSICSLNGTTVYFNGALIPIALIANSDIVGRDDFPCQYPTTVSMQLSGGKTYMTASGHFTIKDTTLYLSLFKLKEDGSNWLDPITPSSITIPQFYFEHTLCAGI